VKLPAWSSLWAETSQVRQTFLGKRVRTGMRWAVLLVMAALFLGILLLDTPGDLGEPGKRALAIFVLCAGLWVSNVIPLPVTSMLALVLLPSLGVLGTKQSFALFGSPAIFFILGAFVLSAAMIESGLSRKLAYTIITKGTGGLNSLRLTVLTIATFASFFMSEHAVAAMLFPIVLTLVKSLDLKPRESRYATSLFLAMAWGCIIGGIATYLGGARNLLAVAILNESTGIQIGFVKWMVGDLPLVIALYLTAATILTLGFRNSSGGDLQHVKQAVSQELKELGPWNSRQLGVAAVSLATILAWIFLSRQLSLAVIALSGMAALFVFGLVRWEDIERNVNWGIILMYGGAIALGKAVDQTGAVSWIVTHTMPDAGLPPVALLLILACLSLVLTEFVSNAAVVTLLMPIGIVLGKQFGIGHLEVIALSIALPSGLAFCLPMATPATAIAFSSGYVKMRQLLFYGAIMNAIALLLFAVLAGIYWPLIDVTFDYLDW